MLSARRRLLGLLLILVIGSGALAFTKLAAWWVIVPPSTMLLGYLALLRAAAKADAERREMAPADVTRTTVRHRPPRPHPLRQCPPLLRLHRATRRSSTSPPPSSDGEEFYDQHATPSCARWATY